MSEKLGWSREECIERYKRFPEDRTLALGYWRRFGGDDQSLFDAAFPWGVEDGTERWDYSANYDDFLTADGAAVLDSESVGSYQGDHLFLLRRGDCFAFRRIGYGSCSGCDALEDAKSSGVSEVRNMRFSVCTETQWKTKAEVIAELRTKPGTPQWWDDEKSEHEKVTERFIAKLEALP